MRGDADQDIGEVADKDVVNALTAGDKSVLGLDADVLGVANELRPHGEELTARRESRGAVEPIVELTDVEEAELRRRLGGLLNLYRRKAG